MNWWHGLVAPGAFVLVMGAVIGWDRWREPRRDPRQPMAVVGWRTYRDAMKRVDRLDLLDERDQTHAIAILTAARQWLKYEIHTGPRRRGVRCAVQLRVVEVMLRELKAPEGLYS